MKLSCQIYRGKTIESQHRAHGVIIDYKGKEIFSFGNPTLVTCIRSSFKPFQAYPIIFLKGDEKFKMTPQDITIMCASHNGESQHINQVSQLLNKIECNENDLQCGSHYPADQKSRIEMIKKNQNPTPIHNNCSGKHAGMLALAKMLNQDITGYTQINHAVQHTILQTLKTTFQIIPSDIAIDGCSAAAPFMTLKDIAALYLALGTNTEPTCQKIYKAISENPYLIGGRKRFDTEFIRAMKGKGISKGGGEGVIGLFINTDKYGPVGISIKIEDGNHRCRDSAVMTVLEYLQLLSPDISTMLEHYLKKPIFNHNNIQIGHIISEISKL